MDTLELAQKTFFDIAASIPQNNCVLQESSDGSCKLIDAGVSVPGGWATAQDLLLGLMDHRGSVAFGHRLIHGRQQPTLDILWDDPVGAAQGAFFGKGDIFGIKDNGGSYALGLVFVDHIDKAPVCGNIIAAKKNSLLGMLFQASCSVPQIVNELLENGISTKEILWAWISSPIAPLTSVAESAVREQEALCHEFASISVWLRGDDSMIERLAKQSPYKELRLHNLATAKTFLSR